ncbi:hypothetical protein SDJN03_09302, partial [Cucurbita argyrosperma subsp. sororia]
MTFQDLFGGCCCNIEILFELLLYFLNHCGDFDESNCKRVKDGNCLALRFWVHIHFNFHSIRWVNLQFGPGPVFSQVDLGPFTLMPPPRHEISPSASLSTPKLHINLQFFCTTRIFTV